MHYIYIYVLIYVIHVYIYSLFMYSLFMYFILFVSFYLFIYVYADGVGKVLGPTSFRGSCGGCGGSSQAFGFSVLSVPGAFALGVMRGHGIHWS